MNEGKINNAPKIPIVYTNASAIDGGGNKSQPAFVFKNTEEPVYHAQEVDMINAKNKLFVVK